MDKVRAGKMASLGALICAAALCVTCESPRDGNQVATPAPVTQTQRPPPTAAAAASPTPVAGEGDWLAPLEPASGRVELDLSGDGRADVVAFDLPPEQVQPSVWLTQRLAFVPAVGGDVYSEQLDLVFSNTSGTAQRFELEYEIPKTFAGHVDEVVFSQEPVRIVRADPVVVFDVSLPAMPVAYAGSGPLGQSTSVGSIRMTQRKPRTFSSSSPVDFPAMKEAAAIMEVQCQQKPVNERTDCWLRWVSSFAGFLSVDRLRAKCNFMPGVSGKICLALAEQDSSHCTTTSTAEDRDFCRLYWVRERCRLAEPKQKQACILSQAMTARSSDACRYLQNADDRNYCLAVVKQLESYCAEIQNLERRAQCVSVVKTSKGEVVQPPATSESWFDVASTVEACNKLVSRLPDYTLGQSSYGKRSISCGYHTPGAEVSCHAKICGYLTAEEAQEYWTEEWGPRSYNRQDAQKSLAARPESTTFTSSATSHVLVEYIKTDKDTYYYIQAASLVGKAVIEFTDYHAQSGSTDGWQAVLTAARAIVDQKAGQ